MILPAPITINIKKATKLATFMPRSAQNIKSIIEPNTIKKLIISSINNNQSL